MATKTEGGKQKPQKPCTEFPLSVHRNGQWAKKIKGKTWFFGTWGNPEEALTCYPDQIDEHSGRPGSEPAEGRRDARHSDRSDSTKGE
jgi:hypothetical protein